MRKEYTCHKPPSFIGAILAHIQEAGLYAY